MVENLKNYLKPYENTLKNLTIELTQKCFKLNINVPKEVASLTVNLLFLIQQEDFIEQLIHNKGFIEELIGKCIQILSETDSPKNKTIQIQSLLLQDSINLEKISHFHNSKVIAKTAALVKEIIDFEGKSSIENQDKIFDKIVIDIIIYNKLGNANNKQVILETSNALKSVLSRTDLIEFMNMKREKRIERLKDFRQLVCGIRLFNKYAGHCGEGIRDIISDITSAYQNINDSLNASLLSSSKNINLITKIFNFLFNYDKETNQIQLNIPEDLKEVDLTFLKETLYLFYQYENYITNLVTDTSYLKKVMDTNMERFEAILKKLSDIVQYRIAVATESVFPHFITLSEIWKILLSCLYAFLEINSMNDQVTRIVQSSRSYKRVTNAVLKKYSVIDKKDPADYLHFSNSNPKIIKFSHDMEDKPFIKFCAYLFVIGDGILIPANEQVGLLEYKGNYFGFSHYKYLNIFFQNIEKYFDNIIKILFKFPQLLIFFDFTSTIFKMKAYRKFDIQSIKKKMDQEVQTELHPIPFNKDKNYEWNVWNLRRKAIQLANIKKYKTSSAQTDLSYHRISSNIQVDVPTCVATETMKNVSVNVENPDTICTKPVKEKERRDSSIFLLATDFIKQKKDKGN